MAASSIEVLFEWWLYILLVLVASLSYLFYPYLRTCSGAHLKELSPKSNVSGMSRFGAFGPGRPSE